MGYTFIKASLIAAMATSIAASGCMAGDDLDDLDDLGETPSLDELTPGDGPGIITGNGAGVLTPELVGLFTPIAYLLASLPLTDALNLDDLLSSLDGHTFLHYLVKCALPEGQSLTVTTFAGPLLLSGKVGIAPEWLASPLSTSQQRWLSACVLAHVNATGAGVPILLRGDHPSLSNEVPDGGAYTLREGAFYGNIFSLIPAKYACTGSGQKAACGGSTSSALTLRKCAVGGLLGRSVCGFSVPGSCYDISGPDACESLSGGEYQACHASQLLPLLPSPEYDEVITVYLQNEGGPPPATAECN